MYSKVNVKMESVGVVLKGEKHMRYLTVLFLTAALAGIASADITMEVVWPDLTGFSDPTISDWSDKVSNMVTLTTSSDWLSAILIVDLTEDGQVFQYPFSPYAVDGNVSSPDPDILINGSPPYVPPLPGLEYDTYLSNGVMGESVQTAAPVDFGIETLQFDADGIAAVWYTSDTDDIGELILASVTLYDTAQGTWTFRATASPAGEGGPYVQIIDGPVVDGYLLPEPATLGLLAIGGLGVLIRRKR